MIEITDIHKQFGRKKVLNGVSFTVNKGEISCLVGVNGVGKTTILNAIMNLTPLKSGKISIDGEKLTSSLYNKIAFIPDAAISLPHYNVQESMDFMADYYDTWNARRAKDIVTFFRLNPSDKLHDLSKGNQAKVNLLLGLALDVDYILMDEPFSGIDVFTREQITEVFSSYLVEDRGVLITTHEINDIEHLLDKVILLDEGKIYKEFNAEVMRETEGKSVIDVMREVYNG
ncbi:ABC transporter ATP-binding protein [Alkalibacterium sp. AK22]|uniref:ATP-binding cassette domain-containing protein n=1 Tax=Alkalibacterium sp. AK22 TaxID=1229520 RepID=UPI0004498E13|nr:ABC transporter ATP-binding protein [Alkalibacterium sp. AK22]EXJ22712.1 ABC transporter ATP-binding protein [Alkalibacterium sp. AK22]